MSVYVRYVQQLLVNSIRLQKAWMAVIKMADYFIEETLMVCSLMLPSKDNLFWV